MIELIGSHSIVPDIIARCVKLMLLGNSHDSTLPDRSVTMSSIVVASPVFHVEEKFSAEANQNNQMTAMIAKAIKFFFIHSIMTMARVV